MPVWTSDELSAIGSAYELRVAGKRADETLRKLVIIWAVRVDDSIYIRSVNGPDAGWFKGTQITNQGHIVSGGVSKDVTFERVNTLDAGVDEAYRTKFGDGTAVRAITSAIAKKTTLRVCPA